MKTKPLVERIGTVPVREARFVPAICDGNVPLEGADQVLHVDLTAARGGDRIAEIERRIRWAAVGQYEKHLVTGHTGSGKSTELDRLKTELQRDKDGRLFHVVFFDIKQHLDPSDIQLPDLVAALFFALWNDSVLHVPAMAAAAHIGKQIIGWMKALGVDVAADLAKGIPALGTLLKNGDLQRRFREKAWDYAARVIEQMGELVQEVRNALVKTGVHDLVIVVDNLEKMLMKDAGSGRTNHDLLFLEQLPKLEALPVHMVITFPVALHADQAQLRASYANATAIQIPMVRVRQRDGHADDPVGIAAMRDLLAKRLDLDVVFSNRAAVDRAIRQSGGCVRDLLRIVSSAVVERGSVPIDEADVESAVRRSVSDFERVLQGRRCLPHLHAIEETGSIPAALDSDDRRWLLLNLIVLEYNGETWYDVHPFARATRAYRTSAPKPGAASPPPPASPP
jgi:hypothetical protein